MMQQTRLDDARNELKISNLVVPGKIDLLTDFIMSASSISDIGSPMKSPIKLERQALPQLKFDSKAEVTLEHIENGSAVRIVPLESGEFNDANQRVPDNAIFTPNMLVVFEQDSSSPLKKTHV